MASIMILIPLFDFLSVGNGNLGGFRLICLEDLADPVSRNRWGLANVMHG